MSSRFRKSTRPSRRGSPCLVLGSIALAAWLGGCARIDRGPLPPRPEEVRALVAKLLPPKTSDRAGWATDIQAAFSALELEPSASNLCAAIAVAEQESGLVADPPVANLPKIARAEIDRRAARVGVPSVAVGVALRLPSPDGRSYAERLQKVRTERELSEIFEAFTGSVPLGEQLFGRFNPVRTGGPMQVRVAFAEQHAREHPYPYALSESGSIRREVFTRRGGMYFGIAHLLGYPADYDAHLYRFADFNAGWWASRNAAFQHAVTVASGIPLALDGDLILHGSDEPGATERAVRTLGARIHASDAEIRRALERGDGPDLQRTDVYRRVFARADAVERRTLPRARVPEIALSGPKIQRKLTTKWFAERVEGRYRRCLERAPKAGGEGRRTPRASR